MKKHIKKALFVAVIGMAMFMDFAIGVLIVAVMSLAFGVKTSIWQLTLGGVLALLPDFDLILPLLRRRYEGLGEHHTSLMHRPFFLLPVSVAVAWYLGGPFWASVTFLCVLWHFVHDTKGFGDGGLEWFWPFSKKEWFLFGSEDPVPKPPTVEWLSTLWLVPSYRSIAEMVLGAIALWIGIALSIDPMLGFWFVVAIAVGTIVVWMIHDVVKD